MALPKKLSGDPMIMKNVDIYNIYWWSGHWRKWGISIAVAVVKHDIYNITHDELGGCHYIIKYLNTHVNSEYMFNYKMYILFNHHFSEISLYFDTIILDCHL